MQWD